MANLKNKKSNVAKKTVTPAAQAAPASTSVSASKPAPAQTAAPKAAEKTTAPKKEETVSVKPAETKEEAKKPVAKKAVVKKPVKKVETVQEVYIEYADDQILTEELIDRIKETYKNEGHRIGAIKSLRVYISLEDRKAYYVINDKAEGKFIEF